MEISPDELYEMIRYEDASVDQKEMIKIVDTYLYTATEILCESIYERLVHDKDAYSLRLGKSIYHQLSMIQDTKFLSPLTREYLDKIKALLPISEKSC